LRKAEIEKYRYREREEPGKECVAAREAPRWHLLVVTNLRSQRVNLALRQLH
jgi:hypothetical protein